MKNTFKSELGKPIERALSGWLFFAIRHKIISYAALVAHFGVEKLITSLGPAVRGKVYCVCNGGGDTERAARIDAVAVALTIATMLKSKIVSEEDICQEVSTDHMVEVLPSGELFTLIFGQSGAPRAWLNDDTEAVAAALEVLCREKLLNASAYVHILGEDTFIHAETPVELLVKGQRNALAKSRDGEVFTYEDLLDVYTPSVPVNYVPLPNLFPPFEAVFRENGWVLEGEEAGSSSDGIPAEALDSILPEAFDEGDDPEIEIGATGGDLPTANDADVLDMDNFDDLEEHDETILREPPDMLMSDEEGDVKSSVAVPPPLKGKGRKR